MSELLWFIVIFVMIPAGVAVWAGYQRLNDGSESPAPKFDFDAMAQSRSRSSRPHDVPRTVAGRADELARTLVDSVALGGPGILRTYVDGGPAEQLYENAVELIRLVEGRARLGIELWPPKYVNRTDSPIQVNVRYVAHMDGDAADKRILRLEQWFWGPMPRRCEVCGAPNRGTAGDCEYCGAAVADQQRWILRDVEVTGSPGAAGLE